MSQGFEKETTVSTAKSLVGALLALSAGFVFMFLGLTAMTNARLSVHSSEAIRPIQELLDNDLMSIDRKSIQLSSDGKILRFRTTVGGSVEKLAYLIDPQNGVLHRESEAGARYLGTFPSARFSSQDGLIVLRWKASSGETRCSWALDRWAVRKKS